MTFFVRVLVVEDEPTEVKTWEGLFEMHNDGQDSPEYILLPTYCASLHEAQREIDTRDFDAAIVDLRLQQEGMMAANADGNAVLESLLESELAVVAIFTGEKALADIPEWASGIVRTFIKDATEGPHAVLAWLNEKMPMIRAIQNAERTIKRHMASLFTKSIWPRWENWIADGASDFLETALSRHIASHIHASLLESAAHKVHPEEWYFVPPIRQGIRTGDLIRIDNAFEVVITPRCDLANNAGGIVQLAVCEVVKGRWDELLGARAEARKNLDAANDGNRAGLQGKFEKATKELRKFVQHNDRSAKVHFLPRITTDSGEDLGPFLVKFDNIRSISMGDETNLKLLEAGRVAAVTPEFLPSLVERLGGYFSRIGTPDYSH